MNELVATYQNYVVHLKDNKTGEVKEIPMALAWFEHSLFWWTEGNFGCDCNRGIVFNEYRDLDLMDEHSSPCGHSRFTAIKAVFPDGTEILIDEGAKGV